MTEREKIIKVIDEWANKAVNANKFDGASVYNPHNAAELADTLIAAGYGDVKEQKFEADHYWSMWQGSLVELERAEHRAEVAEQALLTACVNLIKDEEDNVNMELLARVVYTHYLRKAEKELAEERKDD